MEREERIKTLRESIYKVKKKGPRKNTETTFESRIKEAKNRGEGLAAGELKRITTRLGVTKGSGQQCQVPLRSQSL